MGSSYLIVVLMVLTVAVTGSYSAGGGRNFFRHFDVTWGGGRGKILDGGQLLTLSLDKSSGSGSGFQSKNKFLFGKIDMQLKLVAGNSAGTVTANYVLR